MRIYIAKTIVAKPYDDSSKAALLHLCDQRGAAIFKARGVHMLLHMHLQSWLTGH